MTTAGRQRPLVESPNFILNKNFEKATNIFKNI